MHIHTHMRKNAPHILGSRSERAAGSGICVIRICTSYKCICMHLHTWTTSSILKFGRKLFGGCGCPAAPIGRHTSLKKQYSVCNLGRWVVYDAEQGLSQARNQAIRPYNSSMLHGETSACVRRYACSAIHTMIRWQSHSLVAHQRGEEHCDIHEATRHQAIPSSQRSCEALT